ncbi:MAG: hypothetical protein L0312_30245, partial [Acidobacteria bacterium]|nr:hypothetical protein [Acidobacteriota bacterium]
MVELGDALPDLTERCARLRAVDGRGKGAARLALAQEWGVSLPTLRVGILKARKGPAALKRQLRSDKGKVRGPGDLIAKYGKEKVQEWLRLIDAYLRLQIMDNRGLSLKRRQKDARKECLRLNIDPALISYRHVKRINKSIGDGTRVFFGPQKQRYIDQHQPHVLVEKPAILHTCWSADNLKYDVHLHNPMKRDLRGRVVGGPDRRHGSVIREETSNYWVGLYNSWQANADTLALALHQALSRFSAPRYLKIDNGRDFLSARVRSICYANNIEIIQAEGYHGQSKPCERGIHQLLHDFCKSQEGYCGNNTQSKPDTIRATQPAEEFEAKLNEWLKEYHAEPSTALGGRSPNQVLNSFYEAGFKETPLEAGALRILLMHSKSRTVRQCGVQL